MTEETTSFALVGHLWKTKKTHWDEETKRRARRMPIITVGRWRVAMLEVVPKPKMAFKKPQR